MTKLPSRVSVLSSALTLAVLAATAHAQTWNVTGVTNKRGFHQGASDRNMVRFQKHLYAAVVLEDGTTLHSGGNVRLPPPVGGQYA